MRSRSVRPPQDGQAPSASTGTRAETRRAPFEPEGALWFRRPRVRANTPCEQEYCRRLGLAAAATWDLQVHRAASTAFMSRTAPGAWNSRRHSMQPMRQCPQVAHRDNMERRRLWRFQEKGGSRVRDCCVMNPCSITERQAPAKRVQCRSAAVPVVFCCGRLHFAIPRNGFLLQM